MWRSFRRPTNSLSFRYFFQSAAPVRREFVPPTVDGFLPKFGDEQERNPKIKVLTYNIFAQHCTFHPEVRSCPRELLDWEFRRKRLLTELEGYDADLLCLQDVEKKIYMEQLEPWFLDKGYEGIYYCKPPEVEEGVEVGVVLLYRSSDFTRVSSVCAPFREYFEPIGQGFFFRRVRSLRDGFAMALLTHRASGKEVLVSGLQLYDEPNWPDARIAQIHVMCETLTSFLERQARPQATPIILLGDFSSFWRKSTPDANDKWIEARSIVSGFYSLLTEGSLDVSHCHHPHVRNHQGQVKKQSVRSLQFNTSNLLFESAYYRAHGMEPLVTKYTTSYKDVSDYIFYTPHNIDTKQTLALPYTMTNVLTPHHLKILPMPNALFPSSHFPIGAILEIKKENLLD